MRYIAARPKLDHRIRVIVELEKRRPVIIDFSDPSQCPIADLTTAQRPQDRHWHAEHLLQVVLKMRRLLKHRELVVVLSDGARACFGREFHPRVIFRRQQQCQNILRPLSIHRQMILRVGPVELLDRLHRFPHQVILLLQNVGQIHLSAAAAIASRKEKGRLLRAMLEYNLQDVHIISALKESCMDRCFALLVNRSRAPHILGNRVGSPQVLLVIAIVPKQQRAVLFRLLLVDAERLPLLAARRILEQPALRPRPYADVRCITLVAVNVCEHFKAVHVDHAGKDAADHLAVDFHTDGADAPGPDHRQQNLHRKARLVAQNPRILGPRRELGHKDRRPLHPAKAVCKAGDLNENRNTDGQ